MSYLILGTEVCDLGKADQVRCPKIFSLISRAEGSAHIAPNSVVFVELYDR